MPTMSPHGEKMTCEHELGCITGEALLLFWRDFRDSFIEGIKATCPDWFPMNVVESVLVDIVKTIYNLTWRGITKQGIRIGDKSYGLIFGRAEQEINRMKATIDSVINDAKTRLQNQITNLQSLTNSFRTEIKDLESARDKLSSGFNDLDARFRTLRDQATRDIASLDSRVNEAKAKIDRTINDFQARMDKVNIGLDDAEKHLAEHTDNIKTLFDRVKQLEGQTKEQGDLMTQLKRQIGM